MTDKKQDNKSTLTDEFHSGHGALVLDAKFAAPKVTIGEIFILENDRIEPTDEDKSRRYGLSVKDIEGLLGNIPDDVRHKHIKEQIERYKDARDRTIVTYENHLANADNALIEVRDIAKASLEAELMLVNESSLDEKVFEMIKKGASAEVALDEAYEEKIQLFKSMVDNPYFQKTAIELEQHRAIMQHHLHPDKSLSTLDNIKEGSIVVSSTFPLYALSSFRDGGTGKTMVNGAITDEGSLESHGAILISAMGIPYARTNVEAISRMKNGDKAIMDGVNGHIILHPNNSIIEGYEDLIKDQGYLSDVLLQKSAQLQSVNTRDGIEITINANFSRSDEVHDLKMANPSGIGLYRTEVIADMRYNNVTETYDVKVEDWKRIFEHNMRSAASKGDGYVHTTIRTADLAGDKSDLAKEKREEAQEKITRDQMLALAELQDDISNQGYKNKIKLMIPMISSCEEMNNKQDMMDECAKEVGVKTIKLGCMVEVPALITELDRLDTAFMSVGSNDLIHSILSIDRYDSESIKKYDPTNPAVLKAFDQITSVGEDRDIPVSICGNLASDPRYTALLIGAGFNSMSVGIDAIPAIKEIASRIDSIEARQLFETILETETRAEREEVLEEFNNSIGLSADGRINIDLKSLDQGYDHFNDMS